MRLSDEGASSPLATTATIRVGEKSAPAFSRSAMLTGAHVGDLRAALADQRGLECSKNPQGGLHMKVIKTRMHLQRAATGSPDIHVTRTREIDV